MLFNIFKNTTNHYTNIIDVHVHAANIDNSNDNTMTNANKNRI